MLTRSIILSALALLIAEPVAAATAAPDLVNGTGQTINALFVRRTGTQAWHPLPASPPNPVGGARVKSGFTDPDCAFDIRASLADGQMAEWPAINLCEVKSVTLNRSATGATWADYD